MGDSKSVKQLAQAYENVYGIQPKLERQGSLDDLVAVKKQAFEADPQNSFAWMGLFYQYFIGKGVTNLGPLNNDMFRTVKPKTAEEFMKGYSKDMLGNSMFLYQ